MLLRSTRRCIFKLPCREIVLPQVTIHWTLCDSVRLANCLFHLTFSHPSSPLLHRHRSSLSPSPRPCKADSRFHAQGISRTGFNKGTRLRHNGSGLWMALINYVHWMLQNKTRSAWKLPKDLKETMLRIIAFLVLIASQVQSQVCYTPSGLILQGYGICNPSSGSSLCCAIGDHCFSNSLCETPSSIYYRGGCTSKEYLTGACPAFCGTGRHTRHPLCRGCDDDRSIGLAYFPPGVNRTSAGSAIRIRKVRSINDIS